MPHSLDYIKPRIKITLPIGTFNRLGFVDYFFLDRLRSDFKTVIAEKNPEGFIKICAEIIKLQTGRDLSGLKTDDIIISILKIFNGNAITDDIAFIKPEPEELRKEREKKGEKSEPDPWNFEGRNFYQFVQILASEFGWSLEEINQLDPNVAFYLIQEILAEKQYALERQHLYSEMAYKYDATSKKSVFQPLPRPRWMQANLYTEVKTQVIKRDQLPFGNVIDTTGYGKYGELAPKKESE